MRAHEIPAQAFYYLRSALNGEISTVDFAEGWRFEAMHVRSHEVMIAHVCGRQGSHLFAYLDIWRFSVKREARRNDFARMFQATPDLQVIGGPFPGMKYTAKSGYSMVETVKMFFGPELYRKGISLDDPFLAFLLGVPRIVSRVARQNRLTKLCYWEAYANPQFFPQEV